MDEETVLYYYGARYLDPKYSRWLSGGPALSDYIPKAPIDDEAKKHNENLSGMGGVYNTVNLHLYHYAGIGQRSDSELQANNPVKYEDPDRKALHVAIGAIMAGTCNGYAAGVAGSSIGDLTKQMIDNKGDITKTDVKELITVTVIGTATGVLSNNSIPGITSGKGSMLAVSKQVSIKLANGTIKNISIKISAKIAVARCSNCALVEGTAAAVLLSKGVNRIKEYLPTVDKQQKQSNMLYITNGIANGE